MVKKTKSNKDEEEETTTETKQSTFKTDCIKAFGHSDLYLILNLTKTESKLTDIKKAYYRLSLKYHPDKCVDESLKEENTFKFKLIGKIYSILSDDEKKKVYDETGLFDDDSELDGNCNWDVYFKKMFKKVKEEDIVEFFKSYRGTDQERSDLFDLYEKHKGDFNIMMEYMFSEEALTDEERFKEMLNEGIRTKELKAYDKFTQEDSKKASKRRAKLEKEAKEVEHIRKEKKLDGSEDSLRQALLQNAEKRKQMSDNFLDNLAKKYEDNGKKGKKGKKIDKEEEDEAVEAVEEEEDIDSEDQEEEEKVKTKRKGSVLKKKNSSLRQSIKRRVKRL